MWDIKMKCKEHYNCFQNIIYSMALSYGTSHAMMMMELWGFKYDCSKNGNIGDKISLSWMGQYERRVSLLEKYHGFGFKVHSIESNLGECITKALDESPVGMYIDSFFCEWTAYYGVQHREHVVLCLEELEDKYICKDDTFKLDETIQIPKIFVDKHCKQYLTFYLLPVKEKSENVSEEINKVIEYVQNRNMFLQYEDFKKDIVNCLVLTDEMGKESNNPVTARLFMILKNIADDRLNFIEALEYIEQHSSVCFHKVKECLIDISHRYEKIRAYLIRCCFTGKKQNSDIVNKEFTTIIEKEKEVLAELEALRTC